jgi:D-tyrosyl-tRNA(Tyr) deacylase
MRAVVQRVTSAKVRVDDEIVGQLDRPGLLVLVGVTHDDTARTAERLARKVWLLRVLRDEMSAADTNAPILVVSQFTLYADTRKGRRPSWSAAASAKHSKPRYEDFCHALRGLGAEVETGRFGAMMAIYSVNDGPMTLILDS